VAALLLPVEVTGLYDATHRIESARVYGNIDHYAYYYIDLLIGTPQQRVSVILDTGSGVCAFPCASCGHCGHHIDPAFDFGHSSTASWTPCGSSCSDRCSSGKCSYYQGYTEGSSISGFWFQDYVSLGDSIQHNPAVLGRMGCHQNENNLFYTQRANGILGVGPHSRGGGRTLLQELFTDRTHVDSRIFSICLAEWGGRLVVGGHNESYHTSPVQYTPMLLNRGYYGVSLTGMKVDGNLVATRFGSSMVDSGTTYTYMGSTPYRQLRDAIITYCRGHENCGATLRSKCWDVPGGAAGLSRFPTIEVLFGSITSAWVPKAYLYRKGTGNKWCFAFEDDGAGANTVLGASWMLHKEIIFDMAANRVGIAQANCPEFRERPPPPSASSTLAPTTTFLERTTTTPEPTTTTPAPTTTTPAPTTTTPEPTTTTPEPTTTTPVPTTTTLEPTTTTPEPLTTTAVVTATITRVTPIVFTSIVDTSTTVTTSSARPTYVPLPWTAEPVVSAPTPSPTTTTATTTAPLGGPADRAWVALRAHTAYVGAALGVLAACAVVTCRMLCRRGEHRHVKLKDEDSGMPPQIVGAVNGETTGLSPQGLEHFVIGDDDEEEEVLQCNDEGFDDYVTNGDLLRMSGTGGDRPPPVFSGASGPPTPGALGASNGGAFGGSERALD